MPHKHISFKIWWGLSPTHPEDGEGWQANVSINLPAIGNCGPHDFAQVQTELQAAFPGCEVLRSLRPL